MTEQKSDNLYADERPAIGDFVFDADVAQVFPDMIQRSVPGYAAIINNIGLLTAEHAQDNSCLYDLGCSLGASSLAMANGLQRQGCRIVAIDNAPAMLARANAFTANARHSIEFIEADVNSVSFEPSSMMVMNFTLQFIERARRDVLLARIAEALLPGGIFILSEKISGETVEADRLLVDMHHAFKRSQGYSELEISQKRSALEKVLLPEPVSVHTQRLKLAGFKQVDVWFQCFNFVSFVARV